MLHVHNCAITLYNFYSVTHLLVTIALYHTTHLRLVIVPELLVTLSLLTTTVYSSVPVSRDPETEATNWNWANVSVHLCFSKLQEF